MHDVVIEGGRLVDPAAGIDGPATVVVDGGRVTAVHPVGPQAREAGPADPNALGHLEAAERIDATGMLVCPGFVDLHSHAQTLPGQRLQALDGVTTALDLEFGALPVRRAVEQAATNGRVLNHGWSASWAMARMQVLAGLAPAGAPVQAFGALGDERWQRAASRAEVDRVLALLEAELEAGALGIGLLLGYAQGSDPQEYLDVAALAARAGVPTYTHARDLVEARPDVLVDGADEIVRAAAQTGAAMHYCHVNSTSTHHVERVLALLDRARAEGSTISNEAYPYGAGMTGIGAQFLSPEALAQQGLEPRSVVVAATGEQVADAARLRWLREHEPDQLVILHYWDEEVQLGPGGKLEAALAHPGTIVASDALFPVDRAGGDIDQDVWPLAPTMSTHPRVSGTFARSLRLLVDQVGLTWSQAIARCTVEPARVVEPAAPAMARKGRLTVGSDADVVVFDPDGLRDTATYESPLSPSVGVRHVLVNGQAVVRDGELVVRARPGRAILGQR